MALGINATLREVGRILSTIEIDPGFVGPGGTQWKVTLRCHKDPDFEAACKEAGIHPQTALQRRKERDTAQRRQRNELQDLALGGQMEKAKVALEQLLDNLSPSDGSSWDPRYDVYAEEDLGKLAPLVGEHLVVGIVSLTGDEEEQASRDDIANLFTSIEQLPPTFTGSERVQFAGMPEGEAWALALLRVAVQEHRFWEALAPLGESSESSEESSGSTSGERTSPTG